MQLLSEKGVLLRGFSLSVVHPDDKHHCMRWRTDPVNGDAYLYNNYQEHCMNKDQVKGRIEETKGKAKEIEGNVKGDTAKKIEGKTRQIGGKIQAGYGDLKEDLKKKKK